MNITKEKYDTVIKQLFCVFHKLKKTKTKKCLYTQQHNTLKLPSLKLLPFVKKKSCILIPIEFPISSFNIRNDAF